jgi:hypothetical protein
MVSLQRYSMWQKNMQGFATEATEKKLWANQQ